MLSTFECTEKKTFGESTDIREIHAPHSPHRPAAVAQQGGVQGGGLVAFVGRGSMAAPHFQDQHGEQAQTERVQRAYEETVGAVAAQCVASPPGAHLRRPIHRTAQRSIQGDLPALDVALLLRPVLDIIRVAERVDAVVAWKPVDRARAQLLEAYGTARQGCLSPPSGKDLIIATMRIR